MRSFAIISVVVMACGILACNKTEPTTVVERTTAIPVPVPVAPPQRVAINITSEAYDAEVAQLRADLAALGADKAYEEYYNAKLQEQADWGLEAAVPAPPFTLTDADGKIITLDEIRSTEGPLFIYFYRGGWSPTSRAQMRWLVNAYPELQKAGARVIAVTPERTQYVNTLVKEDAVPFPVLSDPGGQVAQSYRVAYQPDGTLVTKLQSYDVDLQDRNGKGPSWLPVNSMYLVDTSGNVVWRSVDTGAGRGIDFSGAITELQRIQSSAPQRAETTEAGDRAEGSEQAGDRAEDSSAADRAGGG